MYIVYTAMYSLADCSIRELHLQMSNWDVEYKMMYGSLHDLWHAEGGSFIIFQYTSKHSIPIL